VQWIEEKTGIYTPVLMDKAAVALPFFVIRVSKTHILSTSRYLVAKLVEPSLKCRNRQSNTFVLEAMTNALPVCHPPRVRSLVCGLIGSLLSTLGKRPSRVTKVSKDGGSG